MTTTTNAEDIDIDEVGALDLIDQHRQDAIAADRAYSRTPAGQLHRLEIEYSATPDCFPERRAEIMAEMTALSTATESAALDRFLAEWTLDVTKARRIEWNSRIRAGQTPVRIRRETGIDYNKLVKAIRHHGL